MSATTEDLKHWQNLLEKHKEALRVLELQAAEYGELTVPPHVVTQIEGRKEKIADLEAKLAAVSMPGEEQLSVLYGEGLSFFSAGRWQEAIDKFQQVIDREEGYKDAAARLTAARGELAKEAKVRLRQQREAEERGRRRRAQAAELYDDATRLLQRRKYQAALDKMAELRRLEPAHLDPQRVEDRAREGLAKEPEPSRRWMRIAGVVVLSVAVVGIALGIRYLLRGQAEQQVQATAIAMQQATATAIVQQAQATATAIKRRAPTPTPFHQPAAGDARVWEKDGSVMVYVPADDFIMGSPESEQHTIYLSGFWIDRTEVTNEQYRECAEAGTCRAPTACDFGEPTYSDSSKADHPVVCVSWQDAKDYCEWAGKQLPTEAQWEKAARGTDGRKKYPWGDTFDDSRLNFCDVNCEFDWRDSGADDGYRRTAPVGSYPAGVSPYGALDMAGNVWEWCQDWYDNDYYAVSPQRDPQGPDSGDDRVVRGGSWCNYEWLVRAALRLRLDPVNRYSDVGFRCVSPAP